MDVASVPPSCFVLVLTDGWVGMVLLIEAKVSRCFDEMVAIVFCGSDLDDPTTNVRDVAP